MTSDPAEHTPVTDVWLVCGRRVTTSTGRGCTCNPNDPSPRLTAEALTRLNNPHPNQLQPADRACHTCGSRLTTTRAGQQHHPLCDPAPDVLTPQQIDALCARAAARHTNRQEPQP